MNGMSESAKDFYTPQWFAERQVQGVGVPRGQLLIASCRSGSYLAARVVESYQALLKEAGSESEVLYLENVDYLFSDTETCARLDRDVSDHDVFLLQGLYDPALDCSVDQTYMAFLIATRAFREHGAHHITGVLPYLAYARQDKPTRFTREPTTAKLMADLSISAGMDRLVTWHPHCSQIHGFYSGAPVDKLAAQRLFIDVFKRFSGRDDVIVVAPDAGASKFVTSVARSLELESAVASKYRLYQEEAIISEIIGDFRQKRIAIVLDDMISSGGTLHAAIKQLAQKSDIEEIHVGASHNLCTERAYERLTELHAEYNVQEFVVTNTIPQTERFRALDFVSVRDLSNILARVINRIHYSRPVRDLFITSEPTAIPSPS